MLFPPLIVGSDRQERKYGRDRKQGRDDGRQLINDGLLKTVRQMQCSNDKETKTEQVSRCPQDMLGGFIGHAGAEIDAG